MPLDLRHLRRTRAIIISSAGTKPKHRHEISMPERSELLASATTNTKASKPAAMGMLPELTYFESMRIALLLVLAM